MESRINLAVLGSTGSIGTQTLDVVRSYPEKFKVEVLVAGSNVELLIEQAREFKPSFAIIFDESKYERLSEGLSGTGVKAESGKAAVMEAMHNPEVNMVVTSTVGYSGLEPTIEALKEGKDIALANKETLVVAGELVMSLAKSKGVSIFPIDSEHSAVWQCLAGEDRSKIKRLLITASGGPFRTWSTEKLSEVTPEDALRHPNWSMGKKITIDSATMMNKAFEIIEARWLFSLPIERIEAIVHPQSIVHSMVEFTDGALKAQLGMPDMHIPIEYALAKGSRLSDVSCNKYLPLEKLATLTFEKPDVNKFPCLRFAYIASERGGNTACIINAANEIAVHDFLERKIKFTDIPKIIERTLDKVPFIPEPTLEDYIATNKEARICASELTKK